MHQDANVPLTYLRHKGHSSTCKFNDMKYRIFSLFYIAIVFVTQMAAEDGSHLWLRLPANAHAEISAPRQSPTLNIAVEELQQAWKGAPVRLVIQKDKQLQAEGFRIRHEDNKITLTSPTETGLLYAAYHLLRMQETGQNVVEAQTTENPAYNLRILNHWDNMDRTVERGYAGQSLWNWEELPNTLSDRYKEYARANASIGINGTVLNNVNASPKILSAEYLQKVKALADIFRPYGLRVYLSVNFASPMALDSLSTADPLDKEVIRWWKNKVKEIYRIIPDFGGFLVKANSEGQPGPCDFGRTHAEGANMLADALKPYKGIVMWRAFVYSPSDADRAKQAYLEFEPLDGQFRNNVIVQVKNGPIDFQPREPYSPLFGAMQHTPLMAEFQVTQEYLGHSSGQNIFPEEIEARLNNMPFVLESLVIERNKKLVALVYADYEALDSLGLNNPENIKTIMDENLKNLNNSVAAYEKISQIQLYPTEFEKTPKRSIKRYLYNSIAED